LFSTQVRAANKYRQKERPAAPRDLNFTLERNKLPADFLRDDITVDDRRHIIFATDHQLDLLSRARRWYLDATFWVVRKPFSQLWTVHAFLTHEGTAINFLFLKFFGSTTFYPVVLPKKN